MGFVLEINTVANYMVCIAFAAGIHYPTMADELNLERPESGPFCC